MALRVAPVVPEGDAPTAAPAPELDRTEARLFVEALLLAVTDAVWVCDASGRLVLANDAFGAALGRPAGALRGLTPEEVFSPDLAARVRRAQNRVMGTGAPLRVQEFLYPVGSVERRLFETSFGSIRGPGGKPWGTVAVTRDVTHDRLGDEELLGTRDFLFALVNAVGPGWTSNRDHRLTLVSRAAAEIFGHPPSIVIGKTPEQLLPEEEVGTIVALQEEAFRTGREVSRELELRGPEGRAASFLVRAFPYVGPASEALVVSLCTDVTEIRRLGRGLAAAGDFLSGILDAIPDPVFAKDREHRWVFVNDAMCALVGRDRDQLLSHLDSEFFGASQVPGIHERDDEVFRTGRESLVEEDLTVRTGETKRVVVRKSFHVDPEGRPLVVGVIRDVTKTRSDEAALRRANRRLEAANSELEAFVFAASHDLVAPLRRIESFSEFLLEGCLDRLELDGQELLRRIWSTARSGEQLTEDLLTLSRATRGELLRERIDLSSLARELADGLLEDSPGRAVEIDVADGVVVDADRRLLRLCLENLLGNALKFTRGREARIEVGEEGRDVEGERVYFVRDNGVGFEMAFADRLFGVFQRLHRAEDYPGSGIGLALVQRIVHRHGGRVWAESAVGQGTTIRFTLGV
ncbi:MAG TPA: PAS domain-containing protein [Thermoanaerobaculia bacterium]|nr:PAS domain-containing protein [Thermoanaerobaculia bacterium]HQN06003.1 PAS domain-containing protein [Thermoanaerobaculia bacterium]HQP85048.1 PAS domain-containing protein [Thermoanaerobaculia bacterium]